MNSHYNNWGDLLETFDWGVNNLTISRSGGKDNKVEDQTWWTKTMSLEILTFIFGFPSNKIGQGPDGMWVLLRMLIGTFGV